MQNLAWMSPESSGARKHARAQKDRIMANKTLFAAIVLGLSLSAASAYADSRLIDGAMGAGAGALVGGPVGAVAGGAIGYTAGPRISHSMRGHHYYHHHYHHHY
jgi:hypothetical protein